MQGWPILCSDGSYWTCFVEDDLRWKLQESPQEVTFVAGKDQMKVQCPVFPDVDNFLVQYKNSLRELNDVTKLVAVEDLNVCEQAGEDILQFAVTDTEAEGIIHYWATKSGIFTNDCDEPEVEGPVKDFSLSQQLVVILSEDNSIWANQREVGYDLNYILENGTSEWCSIDLQDQPIIGVGATISSVYILCSDGVWQQGRGIANSIETDEDPKIREEVGKFLKEETYDEDIDVWAYVYRPKKLTFFNDKNPRKLCVGETFVMCWCDEGIFTWEEELAQDSASGPVPCCFGTEKESSGGIYRVEFFDDKIVQDVFFDRYTERLCLVLCVDGVYGWGFLPSDGSTELQVPVKLECFNTKIPAFLQSTPPQQKSATNIVSTCRAESGDEPPKKQQKTQAE
uniref:Uncharacterized protein n=1 Tax=Vannella robusta TaxID=1487602 RepID=A0A7S4ICF6_9EUKA